MKLAALAMLGMYMRSKANICAPLEAYIFEAIYGESHTEN